MKSPGGRFWGKETRGVTYIFGRVIVSAQVFSNEEVDTVVFCIDDNFMSWDSNPPYEWKIEGKHKPLRGKHKLSVYAFSESGKMSYDEMDIIIFTRSYQYQKRIFQK